ncbi:hypothetical protein C8035_v000833 [Colletotrichum spinosum]|uniref:Uncharacterized protein n=1 Tax=Colletotrichum spinosum TaxID=1347390 RepID=A0A4R8Q1B0_9PEZI|nr:hypothetical protein C8035_v000833 [Colletotrichum spinosum]
MVLFTAPLPERKHHPGYVEETRFASAYQSRFTEEIASRKTKNAPVDVELLRSLNCNYFSTHGVAPTLLSLKQHAQALAILISQITVSSQYAEINNRNDTAGRIKKSFRDNEAFDWLNDLGNRYDNEDEWHHKPLTDLMNKVKGQSDTKGTQHHCPLETFDDDDRNARVKPRPYAAHTALAMHANECLEMLDHEYSATGGLMSLLPTDAKADEEDMAAVRNSLLGQWLLFNQHLVARTHELELSYANALDITAGEAAVPMQMLSKIGPDSTSGREIAYPQDKWILANAGDDVFDHLHRVFDRQEAQIRLKEDIWKASGTWGEQMWNETRGGDLYARGIVHYDIKTRYFRMQGKGKSTIFILPAHGEHPAVQQTHRVEVRPTVVSVVTPTWPARISDWETKYKQKLDQATRMEIQHHEMTMLTGKLKQHNDTLATELDKARFTNAAYEDYYATSEARNGPERLEKLTVELQTQLKEKRNELLEQKDKMEGLTRLEILEHRLEAVKHRLPDRVYDFVMGDAGGSEEQLRRAASTQDAPMADVSN